MACLANLPRKPTMIIRVTILILNIIVAALLGVAYALAYDGANGWFYADGLGPSLIGICWTAVSSRQFYIYSLRCLTWQKVAWSILWPGIALGLAIFHVQYHPGVDIGLDLFGIGLSWGFAIQLIVWTKDADWTRDWCESEYGYPGETRFCKPARRLDGLEYSSGALLLLAG